MSKRSPQAPFLRLLPNEMRMGGDAHAGAYAWVPLHRHWNRMSAECAHETASEACATEPGIHWPIAHVGVNQPGVCVGTLVRGVR